MAIRINKNIAANYASRIWAGLSTFIFVPAYLRILGAEAFGLISFSASLLGIVFILDMGMSNAFAREIARDSDRQGLGDLLRSLEWIYLALVLFVAAVAILASGAIAEHWLNASHLATERVRWSVCLMLVSAILQVMMALYIGGLMGSNRHATAASYQIGFSFVRSGLVLVPLYFWPNVEFVFIWQLVAAAICLLLLRRTAWRIIAPPRKPRFSLPALHAISGFAGGMFGIALISAINMQSDKIVVSKVFSLDQLGLYAIASLIGQIPSMLALPLAVTVLPVMTRQLARDERADLFATYMRYSFLIGGMASIAMLGVIAGAAPLIHLIEGRTPSHELVNVSCTLAIGGALLAAQYMPYHLAIASGHTRTFALFGCASAIFMPIAMFLGATRIGLMGAAIPWLAMNMIAAIFLPWWIISRYLGPHLIEWTLKANILPLAVSAAAICPVMLILPAQTSPFASLVVIAVFCSVALGINTLLFLRMFPTAPPPAALPTEASQ